MRRGTLSLRARYVFPVEGPPIEDGVVAIEGGRIAWVGPARERDAEIKQWRAQREAAGTLTGVR